MKVNVPASEKKAQYRVSAICRKSFCQTCNNVSSHAMMRNRDIACLSTLSRRSRKTATAQSSWSSLTCSVAGAKRHSPGVAHHSALSWKDKTNDLDKNQYANIVNNVLKLVCPFGSAYVCGQTLSDEQELPGSSMIDATLGSRLNVVTSAKAPNTGWLSANKKMQRLPLKCGLYTFREEPFLALADFELCSFALVCKFWSKKSAKSHELTRYLMTSKRWLEAYTLVESSCAIME